MSAGAFEAGKYEANNGNIYAVRVQPESKGLVLGSLTNTYPTAATDQSGRFALNLGGKRRRPFSARSVSVRFTATPPTGYLPNGILKIPVFRPAFYDGVTVGSTTGTYLGVAVECVGKSAETGL
jgi:hypothetical protein